MKIVGYTVGTPLPKPNFDQTDPHKGDFIKGDRSFITPDDTLTESGRPADAQATGLAITEIHQNLETKADVSAIPTKLSDLTDDSSFAQTSYVDNQDEATLANANEYTDEKIALLMNNSSTAVDSIMELAAAMEENDSVVAALDEAIGKKADLEHTHDDKYYTEQEIDEKVATLNTAISGKADAEHDHAIDDVTGLQSALDQKSDAGHTHTAAEVGARPDTWMPTASDVGGITFKGSNRTEIAAGSDLNNIITLGNYVCSGATTAQGLSNCPTATAFRMEVVAVTGGSDVLNVNSWTYIEQRIQDLNGYEYKRFIHTNNDGVIHYGHGWITTINSNNIGSQSVNWSNGAYGAHVASNADPGSATLKNISAGTGDIGAGAGLATGQLYFVYE